MSAQLHSFPKANPINQKIADAIKRGQKITPWVRDVMHAWAARNPKLPNTGVNRGKNPHGLTCIELGLLPIPCDCFYCSEPAVIFPPEDGSDPHGYCICPCCSRTECPHKPRGSGARQAPR